MKKKYLIAIFCALIFMLSYIISRGNETDYVIKGHYEPQYLDSNNPSSSYPAEDVTKINIYNDDKIEIYSKDFKYTSFLKKYDKDIYTFKNTDENTLNMIFFKDEKCICYLINLTIFVHFAKLMRHL